MERGSALWDLFTDRDLGARAFAVKCASCSKWRLMSSKAKYEAIRECILERPFLCKHACPNASCEDPAKIEPQPDGKYLWAMDMPNIPVPPPWWDRQFIIRSRGASKLGDIYYISPCGKKLRSMVEVDSFLDKHKQCVMKGQCVMEGLSRDRFSYKTPKPFFEGYVGGNRHRSGESDADINTTQVRERGESSLVMLILMNESKLTNQSEIGRPLLPRFPESWKKKRSACMRPTTSIFPQILKKKRSIRMRRTD